MESQKPKIAMYVKRSFGEKLNASFDFIRENWKLMLKFTTYLLLPLCLIQALSLNGMMKGVMSAADMDISSDTALLISFLILWPFCTHLYHWDGIASFPHLCNDPDL